jgi:hypothetical protein
MREGGKMTTDVLLSPCPVCEQAPLSGVRKEYQCVRCGLTVRQNSLLGIKPQDQYRVKSINDEYDLAKPGIVGYVFSLAELKNFRESVYSNQELTAFAQGNFDDLNMPASTLAQILLEQLHETCYIQVNNMRRAHGPILEAGGDRFPRKKVSAGSLHWKDKGNLFLTDARIVFPSNTFTFIRLDRKLTGLKAFENGIAIQRKREEFATYFMGCRAHQAALMAAYIQGIVSGLR